MFKIDCIHRASMQKRSVAVRGELKESAAIKFKIKCVLLA